MSRYLLFKRKAKTSLRQFYSKNNGTVLFFKRYLDIRTFSCRLLQRIPRMDMDET